jgi:uncharacterized membrane protein YeaQ/YmgE (transglycosylase-associated protein family)
MNSFIWCVVGAVCGLLACAVLRAPGLTSRVENVLVGVFGAFIGGEFLAAVFSAGSAAGAFRASALGLSVAGAVTMLSLLVIMRKWVGPMQPHKLRRKTRG